MTEPAKLEVVKEVKPKKVLKPRIEQVVPTDIVDVWRVVERSIRDRKETYPDTTEDSSEVIRSHVFAYLQAPNFFGLIAKIGKRPVGVLLGHIAQRPYGRPHKYAHIWCFWVDQNFRNNGVGKALWGQFSGTLKKNSLFHWEGVATPELLAELQKEGGAEVKQLQTVIGGRI